MNRTLVFTILLVISSALYLVRVQYESRRLQIEWERTAKQTQHLEQENERLRVEKRAHATPVRIEKMAKERLHMQMATPATTRYVAIMASSPTSTGQGKKP
jgi:cell division protein FtsL